jgi:hypothetical protein
MLRAVRAELRPQMDCTICLWTEEAGSPEEKETHRYLIGHTDAGEGQDGHWSCVSQMAALWMDRRATPIEEHLDGSLRADDTYSCPVCRQIVTVDTTDSNLGPLVAEVRNATRFIENTTIGENLLKAVRRGYSENVAGILSSDHVDQIPATGLYSLESALSDAVYAGELEIIRTFLSSRCADRIEASSLRGALMVAAERGHSDSLTALLDSPHADRITEGQDDTIGKALCLCAGSLSIHCARPSRGYLPVVVAILNSRHPIGRGYLGMALVKAILHSNFPVAGVLLRHMGILDAPGAVFRRAVGAAIIGVFLHTVYECTRVNMRAQIADVIG